MQERSIAHVRSVERRRAHRYQIAAPVFFCWALQDEPPESGEGTTRDIDTTGAYINATDVPPLGAIVQLDILLPAFADSGLGAHLIGEGLVLRVDSKGGKGSEPLESGFAISVQFSIDTSETVLTHLRHADRVK